MAIWFQSVAHTLPYVQLDSFDISLAQCPLLQWLPASFKLSEWDLFDNVPKEMLGGYDVVHVRLVFFAVRNEDLRPIIWNLIRLLKLGGYLQWNELNVIDRSFYAQCTGRRRQRWRKWFVY